MSTSIATSTDSGHSGPCTPPRGQALPVHAKSFPVNNVYKYFLPENREQFQKFSYNSCFQLRAFDKSKFLQFLNVELPNLLPNMGSRKMGNFLTLANKVAKLIKDQHEHYLFLYLGFLPIYDFHFRFPNARYPSVQGHGI
jgi:hypothetical protein